jgi:hypothetical protein
LAICFVEYRISERHELEYREWVKARMTGPGGFKLYEGTDQPLLFVEVWEAESTEAAEAIKKERCSERSSWLEMADWVPGGVAKIHVWTFRPVI